LCITETLINWKDVTTVPVGGETTITPGIVVTPAIGRDGAYSGRWAVIHQPSGRYTGLPGTSLDYARELAGLLNTGVDWTVAAEHIGTGHKDAARDAMGAYRDWAWRGLPLWWARWSWTQTAPGWAVQHQHSPAPAYLPWHYLLETVGGPDPEDRLGRVWFDPVPLWELRCAAPYCTDPVFKAPDDERPMRHPDRTVLADEAHVAGWQQATPGRWLCRTCHQGHER